MESPREKQAIRQVSAMLEKLLGVEPAEVRRKAYAQAPDADAVLDMPPYVFVVEWKGSGGAGPVSIAAEQARRHASEIRGDAIPLVAVPYMGRVGRERCEVADVQWLDLSGNARIVAPGLRIVSEGHPNRFKRRGRPSTAFAPKASRIARWLLIHAGQAVAQREMAKGAEIDEGYTSRVVAKLEEDGLIVRHDDGAIRTRDPNLLLDAWREDYDFSKHRIIRGHVAARSSEVLLSGLSETLRKHGIDHAATGLGAAWLFTRFAGFRLVTIYLGSDPTPALLEQLSFREEPRGANVWLVVPNDEGVFQGASKRDGVQCAHPVQVYLDLGGHPERAEEAATELRSRMLRWREDAG